MRQTFIFGFLFFFVIITDCQSQMRGGLTGRVLDEHSGDFVAFSRVMLLQEGGLVQATVSDHTGLFFIANVLPGTYALLAESQGFAPLKITNIPLKEGEWLDVPLVFSGETFESDTLVQEYQPKTIAPGKNTNKKNNKQPKPIKKTAYQRRLERVAKKIK